MEAITSMREWVRVSKKEPCKVLTSETLFDIRFPDARVAPEKPDILTGLRQPTKSGQQLQEIVMSKVSIAIGQRFHRLTVISTAGYSRNFSILLLCRCDCGKEVVKRASHLARGEVKSCGCFRRENPSMRGNTKSTTHGHSSTPAYGSWSAMKFRCSNPGHVAYSEYGGRGITVCERWKSFENFLADMGERPDGMTLDRKDVNKGYSPDNCRWATKIIQCRNRRNNRILTLNGESHCLTEWAEKTGILLTTIRERLRRGWSLARALSITRNGVTP